MLENFALGYFKSFNSVLNDLKYPNAKFSSIEGITQKPNLVNIFYTDAGSTISINSPFNCIGSTIIIIKGDLNINANISTNDLNSGCVFIVTGSTVVGGSGKVKLDSYIISTIFRTTDSIDAFEITGGVITADSSFNRNVCKGVTDISMCDLNKPSEQLNYEGARYIRLFKDILQDPIALKIRESQYNK